MQSSF